ncbi:hypothetical protein K439DRAFT_1623229 [Ramaria rubella]|nr:hypothetical protein K439DRAFT_1623229 [Ramaria rubella]
MYGDNTCYTNSNVHTYTNCKQPPLTISTLVVGLWVSIWTLHDLSPDVDPDWTPFVHRPRRPSYGHPVGVDTVRDVPARQLPWELVSPARGSHIEVDLEDSKSYTPSHLHPHLSSPPPPPPDRLKRPGMGTTWARIRSFWGMGAVSIPNARPTHAQSQKYGSPMDTVNLSLDVIPIIR